MSKEALKLAHDALRIVRFCVPPAQRPTVEKAMQALEEALAQPEQVSEYECRKLLYGFMLDCNAVGLEQAGKNLHRGLKEKNT